MTAVNDLRILAKSVKIMETDWALMVFLERRMTTEHGKSVAESMRKFSCELIGAQYTIASLRKQIEGLRSDMDRASAEILRLEGTVGK